MPGYFPEAFGAATNIRMVEPPAGMSSYSLVITILASLVAQMRRVHFVFLANELDQFGIHHDALVHLDGPGLGVGLRVVDGDLYFQVPEVGAAVALGDVGGSGQRAALDIQPS